MLRVSGYITDVDLLPRRSLLDSALKTAFPFLNEGISFTQDPTKKMVGSWVSRIARTFKPCSNRGGFLECAKQANPPPSQQPTVWFSLNQRVGRAKIPRGLGLLSTQRDPSLPGSSPISSEVPIASPFKKTCPFEFTRNVRLQADNPLDHLFCRVG